MNAWSNECWVNIQFLLGISLLLMACGWLCDCDRLWLYHPNRYSPISFDLRNTELCKTERQKEGGSSYVNRDRVCRIAAMRWAISTFVFYPFHSSFVFDLPMTIHMTSLQYHHYLDDQTIKTTNGSLLFTLLFVWFSMWNKLSLLQSKVCMPFHDGWSVHPVVWLCTSICFFSPRQFVWVLQSIAAVKERKEI